MLPGPDAFGMRQQSGEYFGPNSMLSSFSTDFAFNFGGEDQKNKKDLHCKILVLDHVHLICRAVSYKSVCCDLLLAKVCWSSCASTKIYSRLEKHKQ